MVEGARSQTLGVGTKVSASLRIVHDNLTVWVLPQAMVSLLRSFCHLWLCLRYLRAWEYGVRPLRDLSWNLFCIRTRLSAVITDAHSFCHLMTSWISNSKIHDPRGKLPALFLTGAELFSRITLLLFASRPEILFILCSWDSYRISLSRCPWPIQRIYKAWSHET